MKWPDKRLRILYLVLSIGETNNAYMEHCLPQLGRHDITLCTYFRPHIRPPKQITLYEGDDSLKGFVRVLKAALAEQEYDIIHAHSPHVGFSLAATLLRSRKSLSATVVTVHNSFPSYKLRNRLLFIPVFACFRRVVCCSQAATVSTSSMEVRGTIKSMPGQARIGCSAGKTRIPSLEEATWTSCSEPDLGTSWWATAAMISPNWARERSFEPSASREHIGKHVARWREAFAKA